MVRETTISMAKIKGRGLLDRLMDMAKKMVVIRFLLLLDYRLQLGRGNILVYISNLQALFKLEPSAGIGDARGPRTSSM